MGRHKKEGGLNNHKSFNGFKSEEDYVKTLAVINILNHGITDISLEESRSEDGPKMLVIHKGNFNYESGPLYGYKDNARFILRQWGEGETEAHTCGLSFQKRGGSIIIADEEDGKVIDVITEATVEGHTYEDAVASWFIKRDMDILRSEIGRFLDCAETSLNNIQSVDLWFDLGWMPNCSITRIEPDEDGYMTEEF